MRLDAHSPLIWRQINGAIKEKLAVQSNVFLYRGMHQAIFETLLGLHLRFSHKRKLVAETGFGDHLAQAEIELAKLGVRFKDSFEEDKSKEEKACLAYVHDLDDALTGELYNHIETLKDIAATKMYRIHLAHHLFHVKKTFVQSLTEFDIIIASLSKNHALVFTGEKVSLPTLVASQLPWSVEKDLVSVLKVIDRENKMYQEEIAHFESNLPGGVRPWFHSSSAKRVHDRAIVVLDGYDGEAMMTLLLKALEMEKPGLGLDNKIETASLCRWQNPAWFQQSEKMGRTQEELQGTIMVDGSLLSTGFSQLFKQCFTHLQSLSN